MTLLSENNLRSSFIALSRALDPREAPRRPDSGMYINRDDYDKALDKHAGEVTMREGRAIEAAVSIAEEVVVLFQRFVVSQERMADAISAKIEQYKDKAE